MDTFSYMEDKTSFFEQAKDGEIITINIEPISCYCGPMNTTIVSVVFQNKGIIARWANDIEIKETRKKLFWTAAMKKKSTINEELTLNSSHLEKIKRIEFSPKYSGCTSDTCLEFIYNQQSRQCMVDGIMNPISLFI